MSQVNIISFRANIPIATQAGTPVSVALEPMSYCLHRVIIFSSGTVDFSKAGFRLRNNTQLLVPDVGSQENITLLAAESNWSPLVNSPIDLDFKGRYLDGPPYSLIVDAYNTTGAAIQIGGFIHTSMPEYTIHDLVIEMQRQQEIAKALGPIPVDPQLIRTEKSDNAPYPVMQQAKKK